MGITGTAIMFLLAMSTAGCDLNVSKYELDGYEARCNCHGGVYSINNASSSARCMDGFLVRNYDEEEKCE
jgi:hypothetical protein